MDGLKRFLLEVGIRKMGPSAIRAAILAVAGFVAAKAELFAQLGIVYDATAKLITIDLAKLDSGAAVLLIGTAGAGGALIKLINHQSNVVVKKMIDTDGDGIPDK